MFDSGDKHIVFEIRHYRTRAKSIGTRGCGTIRKLFGGSKIVEVTALVIKEAELQSIFGEEARRKVTVIPSRFVKGREFDSLRRLDGRRSSAVRAFRRNRKVKIIFYYYRTSPNLSSLSSSNASSVVSGTSIASSVDPKLPSIAHTK